MNIDNIVVREVEGGMFNLNDLYYAAVSQGVASIGKHMPKYFMRLQSTVDLYTEIAKGENSSPFKKVMGRNGGTYVSKELVYAYAMWISPEFHLKVINCFDAVASKNPAVLGQLSHLVNEVDKASKNLIAICNESSIALHDIKKHGSDWGVYGAAIRKAKLEATKRLNEAKAEIQLKLDLLG